MYSFNQRPDTVAIDEPFYGIWLKTFDTKDQPCFYETTQTMKYDDVEKVHDEIENQEKLKGNIFVKNMSNIIKLTNKTRLLNYRHILLIRDPAETIVSHYKIDPLITSQYGCLKDEAEFYDWLKATTKQDPIVVDGNEIRKDPKSVLTQICNRLDLPFTDEMLSWPIGPKSCDGVWAKVWYNDVHATTGFRPLSGIKITENDIPTEHIPFYHEVLPYYRKLLIHSIQA
ncbi:unnamed protein product [Rotaria sp. Silwood1]|nr:unnamed protein product [Rotaria sp. Silwood1]CAF1688013.1 unnamed protein product [Rotaria sp. Silwood1]CAF3725456.1 unnamed protein product [Rotaria sp. Silwood1]CAF3883927.1 unnamed protein product [Rotaria sp. Silwood1]CAF3963078.1 unnamed protein product [Rotaria sp. Silwood1]